MDESVDNFEIANLSTILLKNEYFTHRSNLK